MKPYNPIATDTDTKTHTFKIESATTGHVFGEYEAANSKRARDAFARDAGYDGYDDLLSQVPRSQKADIKVSRVDR